MHFSNIKYAHKNHRNECGIVNISNKGLTTTMKLAGMMQYKQWLIAAIGQNESQNRGKMKKNFGLVKPVGICIRCIILQLTILTELVNTTASK